MVMPRAIVVAGAVILAVVAVIIGLIVATVATIKAVYAAPVSTRRPALP